MKKKLAKLFRHWADKLSYETNPLSPTSSLSLPPIIEGKQEVESVKAAYPLPTDSYYCHYDGCSDFYPYQFLVARLLEDIACYIRENRLLSIYRENHENGVSYIIGELKVLRPKHNDKHDYKPLKPL